MTDGAVENRSATRLPALLAALAVVLIALAGCNPEPSQERFDASGSADLGVDVGQQDTATKTELGEVCVEDGDCASGRCEEIGESSVCTTACRPTGCEQYGMACVAGRCVPSGYCKDADGDGYGEGPGCKESDCDDQNADVNPGAEELCGNAIDDNCNKKADEGFERLGDTCSDGKGVCRVTGRIVCSEDKLSLECGVEAEEAGEEICDGLDNDCDGKVDNQLNCRCKVGETQPCYTGGKETRGLGICEDGIQTCQEDGSWGECTGDVLPEDETCDGRDNSCSGVTDDVDGDNDGFWGCPSVAQRDCDDKDPQVHPGAGERCNRIDDNCNGLVDENAQNIYYLDNDGDGWGKEAKRQSACSPPNNYVDKVGDCNDLNKEIYPGAQESCNDIDDDCDAKVDEGLPTATIRRDVDNDGYSAPGARSRKKCLYDRDGDGTGETPPVGWATEQGDCDDTDSTRHPDARALCDDKDNDCDGVVDRWCGEACAGSWPASVPGNDHPKVVVADLDQDGNAEIGATHSTSAKLLRADGTTAWTYQGNGGARRAGIVADIDHTWRNGRFTLEWVFGPRSSLSFLRKTANGYELVDSGLGIYDAASHLGRDLDDDGNFDFVSARWAPRMRVAEYDPNQDTFVNVVEIPTPDGKRIYTNGEALTDVDGDGRVDVLFGSGHSRSALPSRWGGNVYAFGVDKQGKAQNLCKNCYDTTYSPYYPMDVSTMFVHDSDGDGAPEVQAGIPYAKTNQQNVNNTRHGNYRWNFDLKSGKALSGPTKGARCLEYDADGDGQAECHGFEWTHDVDGDGDEDRVVVSGGNVHLEKWENGQWTRLAAGAAISNGAVRWLGDLQGDGRLDAVVSSSGKVHCFSFGKRTYHPWKSHGPPMDAEWTQRTFQRDNWEPNDSKDRAFRVYNEEIMYRGYMSDKNDVDWFEIGQGNGWCGYATVQAPEGVDLEVKLYGKMDRNQDGKHDVLSSKTIKAGKRGSLSCSDTPNATGKGRYWLEIRAKGAATSATSAWKAKFRVNR